MTTEAGVAPKPAAPGAAGAYRAAHPGLGAEIVLMRRRGLPPGWERDLPDFPADFRGIGGREATGMEIRRTPMAFWRGWPAGR